MERKLDPTTLVIFGATGELSRERLFPALFHLHQDELLPRRFNILGFARSNLSHQEFRERVKPKNPSKKWGNFSKKILYLSGDFTNARDFKRLWEHLRGLEERRHSCANRLFYFATLPSHYETIAHELGRAGLLRACHVHKRQTRVVIEKPFGYDLASAQKLDRTLNKYFEEGQVYRIDHYLGKETVQNLLTVRFANSIFEPIWNRNFIDHVQISALEERGIENRGALYEKSGAIRDFMQNHLMQLLALVAMEPPADLSTNAIRTERAKVINSIIPPTAASLKKDLIVGQYDGYAKEANVRPKSRVETFAAVKLMLNSKRFAGVPFYLRSGKKLKQKISQVSIHFKEPVPALFETQEISPNVLTFEIQPNEGLFLQLTSKYPGFGIRLHPVTMELGYHSAFKGEFPEAYERLLLDFMEGDQRLFARSDEIEYSWKYIDILTRYLKTRKTRMVAYQPGSWGPKSAESLITKDRKRWLIS